MPERGALEFMSGKIKREWTQYSLVIFLFLFSVVIRGLLSDYPKLAWIYRDELYYPGIAKDLWNNGTISVYRVPVDFSKILYSIVLAPFFSINNGPLRISIISWFNSVLVSSSIFPAWLIGKKVIKDNRKLLFSVILFLSGADMCFSVTFMAENLFLPMGLWAVLFVMDDILRNKVSVVKSFFLGAYLYFVYLCKEAGGAIAIASLVMHTYVASRRTSKERNNSFISIAFIVLGFITLYVIGKITLFRDISYSYSGQVSINSISDSQHLVFFLFALLYNSIFVLIQWGLFPVLLPAIRVNKMDTNLRLLFLFTVLCVLFTVIGVSYGVTLPENMGNYRLRIHGRYFIPFYFPVLICFVANTKEELSKTEKRKLIIGVAVALIVTALIVYPPQFGSPVDAPMLEYARQIENDVIFRVMLSSVWLILLFIAVTKAHRFFLTLTMFVFGVASVVNNALFLDDYFPGSAISPENIVKIQEVEEVISSLDNDILVVEGPRLFANGVFDNSEKLFDSYISQSVYKITASQIAAELVRLGGTINMRTDKILSAMDTGGALWTYEGIDAEYLLFLNNAYSYSHVSSDNAEIIPVPGLEDAKLIRVNNGIIQERTDLGCYYEGEEIVFYGTNNNCEEYLVSGFGAGEASFRWTNEKKARMIIKVLDYQHGKDAEILVKLAGICKASQHCLIYVNNSLIFDDVLTVDDCSDLLHIVLPADSIRPEDDTFILDFHLPDATQPGNGDIRKLGIALQTLKIVQ